MTTPACLRIVLLVEDEGIIGLTLEDELTAAGYVVGPFTTCASALGWLQSGEPHTWRSSSESARRSLHGPRTPDPRAGRPLVVYSGTRQEQASPEVRDAPWLGKPARMDGLVRALRDS
jgi:hypothetical protein